VLTERDRRLFLTGVIHGRQIGRHKGLTENNAGHEIAGHDKYRMRIDYITLECAFLLNFNFFWYV